jgi:Cys-tRNA(Pro) deacylase
MAHANVARVQAAFAEQGITIEPVEFPDSTHTSAEAAAAIGVDVAQIAKSLVFVVDSAPILVIASGVNRVDTAKVAALLGVTMKAVKRADADTVRAATGYAIGGVPPLGHTQALRAIIDRDLLRFDVIWAAAGTPNTVFKIAPAELARVTNGQVADVRSEMETPER